MNNSESKYNKLDENDKEINKIYNEAGKYLEDYDFQSYILPLLNPDSFTTEKIHNLEKVLQYYKEEKIFLPLIDDPRYEFIKNYEEFEFSNCIAYEMLIRTDEFQKAKFLYMIIEDIQSMYQSSLRDILNSIKESLQYFHKDIQNILSKYINSDVLEKDSNKTLLNKILVDLIKELENSKIILKDLGILNLTSFLGQDMIDLTDENFVLIDQVQRDLPIKDFDNGLELLIKFYLTKESIYIKNDTELKFEKIKYSNIEEILNKILDNIGSYYLEINSNIIQLSKNMTISMLDGELKDLLKKHYNKYKYINIQPNYTRPSLHFIDAKIVNLPINLNFSRNELIALVSKIKDDYDNKESRIKTPLEILGEKLEKFIKPNSENKLPSKTFQEKRIAFANAFCVYDLDKVLAPIFDKKNEDFRKKQGKGEIDKDETNPYTKEYLKSEISSITGLSEDNIKVYRTLMKEYINKKKFVDLIKGFSNNK